MKSRYIYASALSLAVVGASIVSPFSYAFDEIDVYNDITGYFDTITGLGLISVLDNFYSYGYIGLQDSGGRLTRLSLCIDYITTRTNGFNKMVEFHYRYPSSINGSLTGANSITLVNDTLSHYEYIDYGAVRYLFEGDNRIIYFDMPDYYFPDSNSESKSASVPTSFTTKLSSPPVGNFSSNITFVADKYEPPTPTQPPYTTPAPAFPNLPDNWVNGDGNTYNIDLPDFDFNLELPEYTMPEAVSIPVEFVQKSSSLYQIPLNIIDRFGLWWLVGLALICTVITLIINR